MTTASSVVPSTTCTLHGGMVGFTYGDNIHVWIWTFSEATLSDVMKCPNYMWTLLLLPTTSVSQYTRGFIKPPLLLFGKGRKDWVQHTCSYYINVPIEKKPHSCIISNLSGASLKDIIEGNSPSGRNLEMVTQAWPAVWWYTDSWSVANDLAEWLRICNENDGNKYHDKQI